MHIIFIRYLLLLLCLKKGRVRLKIKIRGGLTSARSRGAPLQIKHDIRAQVLLPRTTN